MLLSIGGFFMQNFMSQQPQFNNGFMPTQQRQPNFLRMIAVTNKEEANATPVEFNGVPMFFFNQNTNEIYLKQFDITTGGKLETYRKVDAVAEEKKEEQPLQINEDIKAINTKIDSINSLLATVLEQQAERGGKNAK